MKRALLGTTALVAASVTGAGEAQAGFDVTVNGNYSVGAGVVDQDTNGQQNSAINEDFEVFFQIVQTLDNGMTVGGRVELEGFSSGDQIDERWIYFRGGFGEIRVGDEDDARKLMSYTAPNPTNFLFGVNSPSFTFQSLASGQVVSTNSTTPFDGDSSKIIYFTPSFSGFQLAVSYAPDATQDRTGFGTGGTQDTVSNLGSIGASWSGEFGGVTIGAGGGYSFASAETNGPGPFGNPINDDSPSTWAAGVNVGFGGFTIGGSIAVGDELDSTGYNGYSVTEATVFDVGVTYAFEAVTLGIAWSHGVYQQTSDGEDDDLDFVNLGAGYQLGEGILLAAFVGWFDYEDGGPTSNDNTGWQTGIGAGLDF